MAWFAEKNRFSLLAFSLVSVGFLFFVKHELVPTLSLNRDLWFNSSNSLSLFTKKPNSVPVYTTPKPVTSESLLSSDQSNYSMNSSIFETTQVDISATNGVPVEETTQKVGYLEEKPGFNGETELDIDGAMEKCDIYTGKWVKADDYPLYPPGSCPYVDEAFSCQENRRPDVDYLNWRWKPDGCEIPRQNQCFSVDQNYFCSFCFSVDPNKKEPIHQTQQRYSPRSRAEYLGRGDFLNIDSKFNAIDFLERIRGKRLMLVGDSMNRNQFESMVCLLHEALPNKSRMYERHGYRITKGRGYYIFQFMDYNSTIEFSRSHFLVREGTHLTSKGKSRSTLMIDQIERTSTRWKHADILIFNTGHWWTHGKTSKGKDYYQEGDYIYPQFDSLEGYKRAMRTWGKWIDQNLDPKKYLVFYRGYSNAHFRGGDWDSGGTCNGETEPISRGNYLENYPVKMRVIEEVIHEMKTPVIFLNITRLTNYRKDAHPSIYSKTLTAGQRVSKRVQDCSHWCLPGVPDAWNELIYATLVMNSRSKSG